MKKAKLTAIAPMLVVKDVVKTSAYYREVLGFSLVGYFGDPPVYAMVERGGFEIHFGKADEDMINKNEEFRKISSDLVIWVPEIETFFEELKSTRAKITDGITRRSYGREFIINDCDGHKILVCD
jgi:predicted enzyme related to lactoylglutathione lyase